MEKICIENENFTIKDCHINSNTSGTDALAHVIITISDHNKINYTAEALHEDITMASTQALIKCLNLAIAQENSDTK